jgi:hypothetical protein
MRVVMSPVAAISAELRLVSVEDVAPVTLVEPLVAPMVLLVDGCSLVLRVVSVDAIVAEVD